HAFRARALLAKAMFGSGEPSRAVLDEARAAAEAALALEPGHLEGRLQKAIALSLILRPMSLGEARRTGYGELSKSLAEGVLAEDPANHYAHGFLAVWNVEVVRRGGRLGAMVMGASVRSAEAHYAEAVRLAPEDIGLRWQWARALAALDARKYRAEIDAELTAAAAFAPVTDMDRVMQDRAATLIGVLHTARAADTEARAQRML
ncbi:MAG: hypothetical protein ACK4NO_08960, partial [Glycocaulis sp.]